MRVLVVLGLLLGGCDWIAHIDYHDPINVSDTSWTHVSAGNDLTCAINASGELYCWGYNGNGQTGTGMLTSEVDLPALVSSGTPWQSVAAGLDHTCAIQTDGTLWCWGANFDGQLGIGNMKDQFQPAQVGTDTWLSVSTVGAHACAIRQSDSSVFCWGLNTYGQLGDGSTTERIAPVAVTVPGVTGWLAVAAATNHSCALSTAGNIWCWGANYSGQLGVGGGASQTSPVMINTSTKWTTLDAGDDFTCGLDDTGTAWCWGDNAPGRLGDATTGDHQNSPLRLSTTEQGFTEIATGWGHACALRADSTIACWGDEAALTGVSSSVPATVSDGPGMWTALSLGHTHTCGIGMAGDLWCVGDGSSGQLGNGMGAITSAIQVATGVSQVEAGPASTCMIDVNGMLSCWGENDHDELGDGTQLRHLVPEMVDATAFAQLGVGTFHGCALDESGHLWCWGTVSDGGLGDTAQNHMQPTQIGSTSYDALAVGGDHTCAMTGQTLSCWGRNSSGELGIGTEVGQAIPKALAGAWQLAVAGTDHTCALDTTGKIMCTGANDEHQIGDTTTTDRSSMTASAQSTTFTKIFAGTNHSCAIGTGGAMCWGRAFDGELGNAATGGITAPVTVSVFGGQFTQLALGDRHTCGLGSGGDVYCWGYNDRGQLGNGSTNQSLGSVFVQGLPPGIVKIAAGNSHTCAIDGAGTLWCWGDNRGGQLGTGTSWTTTFFEIPPQ